MCRFIKMEKEGKSVGPVRCRLCHKEGHMAKNCPRLSECTDVDEKGESKKMWHCFNCCQKADHAPVDCPYHVQRWRVHTNSKRFFEALELIKPVKNGCRYIPDNTN